MVEPSITSYCVQKLMENVDYMFRVMAENKVGVSEPLETEKTVTIKSPYGKIGFALYSVKDVDLGEGT